MLRRNFIKTIGLAITGLLCAPKAKGKQKKIEKPLVHKWRRWSCPASQTTPLCEGETPAFNRLSKKDVSDVVEQIKADSSLELFASNRWKEYIAQQIKEDSERQVITLLK